MRYVKVYIAKILFKKNEKLCLARNLQLVIVSLIKISESTFLLSILISYKMVVIIHK